MALPGGMLVDGRLSRDYVFKPLTGALELSLSEVASGGGSTSARVSQILFNALASLAGEPVTLDAVRQLSVGDRQYLMRALARHIDDAPVWITAGCGRCAEAFDVLVAMAELPVKAAGKGYPVSCYASSLGELRLRVPNGEDQEAIAGLAGDAALTALAARLITDATGGPVEIAALAADELPVLERVIEDMAPEVATEMLTHCPQCQTENRVPLNPYYGTQHPLEALFADIHVIASRYHWSEGDILALPRRRRQTYLAMIDRGRNMMSELNSLERG